MSATTTELLLSLTRRYRFAASHRLHSAQLSEAENQRVYGKCANPYGHGHNYVVEVTMSGPVNPQTGMIANLPDLDAFIGENVIEAFDHRNLNEEIAEFQNIVPTTENVCREIFRRAARFPEARLERIGVEETGSNSFECTAEGEGTPS
ncbi:MAG TPA: 6-carboxytetrahydropterin synthase [Candidatus Acidoferrum sp.]|nr:6-carboxytetrahydropterin synthase [Candidatus Acidoferrum sp.]